MVVVSIKKKTISDLRLLHDYGGEPEEEVKKLQGLKGDFGYCAFEYMMTMTSGQYHN